MSSAVELFAQREFNHAVAVMSEVPIALVVTTIIYEVRPPTHAGLVWRGVTAFTDFTYQGAPLFGFVTFLRTKSATSLAFSGR